MDLHYLGECNHDAFVNVASSLGILLCSKFVDANSACAMLEEANVPLQAQHVILHHLANFFGQCLIVPESQIRELEAGACYPISDSVVLDRQTITYWYRKIVQAILDHLHTELKFRGNAYFWQFGFNSIDIVFCADHGTRRFREVIKIIFRKKEDATASPICVVITIGNIDCTQETHDILEKKIATPIN
jgi:hypothetical protein